MKLFHLDAVSPGGDYACIINWGGLVTEMRPAKGYYWPQHPGLPIVTPFGGLHVLTAEAAEASQAATLRIPGKIVRWPFSIEDWKEIERYILNHKCSGPGEFLREAGKYVIDETELFILNPEVPKQKWFWVRNQHTSFINEIGKSWLEKHHKGKWYGFRESSITSD